MTASQIMKMVNKAREHFVESWVKSGKGRIDFIMSEGAHIIKNYDKWRNSDEMKNYPIPPLVTGIKLKP